MSNTIILPDKLTRTITIETEIDKKDFVHIPDTTYFISKKAGYKGQNYDQTLQTVEGSTALTVATPALFMPHYARVCRAALEKDITLDDGTGELLGRKATDDLFEYLSTEAWAWLDASFEKTKQGFFIATDHRLVNGQMQPLTRESLETCVMKEGFVDLVFNRQGFPTQRSEKQEYQRGKNLQYWHPENGTVAGFYALGGYALLDCDGLPLGSFAALGVFVCAEGAAKN